MATWEANVGPQHPDSLGAAASLALIDTRSGELARARALPERVLRDSREVRGRSDRLRIRQGRLAEARALLVALLPLAHGKLGPHSLGVAFLGLTLGRALYDADVAADAVPLLHESLALFERLAPTDTNTIACAMVLASAIVRARGEPALARAALARASERVRQLAGPDSPLLASLVEHGVNLGLAPS